MEDATDDISVITITRRRPELLPRAIASVRRQAHVSQHIVIVDACDETMRSLLESGAKDPRTILVYVSRRPWEHSGPGRSSQLRNLGVRMAGGSWIAFLDDDNQWEDAHLSSLRSVATEAGAAAAHSYRKVLTQAGEPYLEESFPWATSEEDGRRAYRQLVDLGVVEPGSCVRRDRVIPGIPLIDTSAWLLARDLLVETPFREDFTPADARAKRGEDDKLLADLLERRALIVCSELPTLRYYLGGYSNSDDGVEEGFSWATSAV